ncbi:MAG: hypothetical protein KGP29_00545 [Proteobacteria bacterium]|nr:hypothetical protein [Pseudomonadota bacterium]
MLPIPNATTHRLKSKINAVEYELFVVVPAGYSGSKERFPVIFTTDPDFIFLILLGVAKSLATMIPEAIIVGIGHADLDFKELDESTRNARAEIHRARDLLPWKFDKFTKFFTHADLELEAKIVKHSGRAEEFKNFIASEVIPFIDKSYRTKAERTLIGHSFGGLFASWIALNHPEIFQNYLVISPIFHYEDGRIFEEISNLSKVIPAKIYLSAGACENFHPDFFKNLKRFHAEISALENISTKLEIFEGEYHCSTLPLAISKGLRFVFSSKP